MNRPWWMMSEEDAHLAVFNPHALLDKWEREIASRSPRPRLHTPTETPPSNGEDRDWQIRLRAMVDAADRSAKESRAMRSRMMTSAAARDPARRRRSAVHEACHCVAAHALFGRGVVVEAGLDGCNDDWQMGHMHIVWPDGATTQQRLTVLAVADVGVRLHLQSCGWQVEPSADLGDGGDREQAAALLGQEGEPRGPAWEEAIRQAHRFLGVNWPTVNAIAEALIERESLTGGEVDQMCEYVIPLLVA